MKINLHQPHIVFFHMHSNMSEGRIISCFPDFLILQDGVVDVFLAVVTTCILLICHHGSSVTGERNQVGWTYRSSYWAIPWQVHTGKWKCGVKSVGEWFVLFWAPAHIFNISGDLKLSKTFPNIGRWLIDSGDSETDSTAILVHVILCLQSIWMLLLLLPWMYSSIRLMWISIEEDRQDNRTSSTMGTVQLIIMIFILYQACLFIYTTRSAEQQYIEQNWLGTHQITQHYKGLLICNINQINQACIGCRDDWIF